ncbi:hypothetical protein ARTHRO9V_160028 [Arthrobacter sp. 9V]|nr:hypothetical protein ARTHRO9V_160028 [Arthrobacter sp. 9V]
MQSSGFHPVLKQPHLLPARDFDSFTLHREEKIRHVTDITEGGASLGWDLSTMTPPNIVLSEASWNAQRFTGGPFLIYFSARCSP